MSVIWQLDYYERLTDILTDSKLVFSTPIYNFTLQSVTEGYACTNSPLFYGVPFVMTETLFLVTWND